MEFKKLIFENHNDQFADITVGGKTMKMFPKEFLIYIEKLDGQTLIGSACFSSRNFPFIMEIKEQDSLEICFKISAYCEKMFMPFNHAKRLMEEDGLISVYYFCDRSEESMANQNGYVGFFKPTEKKEMAKAILEHKKNLRYISTSARYNIEFNGRIHNYKVSDITDKEEFPFLK